MKIVRGAMALWLVGGTLALRPSFSKARVLELFGVYPELTVFALLIDALPIVVGLAWYARASGILNGRQAEALRLATRGAALLNVAGLLMPFHSSNAASAFEEIVYRATVFVALLLVPGGSRERG